MDPNAITPSRVRPLLTFPASMGCTEVTREVLDIFFRQTQYNPNPNTATPTTEPPIMTIKPVMDEVALDVDDWAGGEADD